MWYDIPRRHLHESKLYKIFSVYLVQKTSLWMGISMLKLQLIFLILQQRVSLNKLRHFVSFNTSGRILLAELNYKLGCFSFKFIFIRLKVYNY